MNIQLYSFILFVFPFKCLILCKKDVKLHFRKKKNQKLKKKYIFRNFENLFNLSILIIMKNNNYKLYILFIIFLLIYIYYIHFDYLFFYVFF